MKKIFIVLGILLSSRLAFASSSELYWQFDHQQYEHNMNMVATVYVDGVEQQNNNLELGVFCGDEVRGSALPSISNITGKYVYNITLFSDAACELTFKLYDHNTASVLELDCNQSYTFEIDATEGTATEPYKISFITPIPAVIFTGEGSWNDVNNWQNKTLPTADDDVVVNGAAVITNKCDITVNSLVINENKSLTIQDGGLLTVTEKLSNGDPNALIIEEGGQIVQTSKNVAATFNKNIVNPTSWSTQKSGWQFVSSPMINAQTEGFLPASGDYDLYKFDGNEELQWVNYKSHNDFETEFQQGVGYLASYETQTIASFKGVLYNETIYHDFPISYNSNNDWANFHLLGNPFSFDIVWEDYMNYNSRRMEDGFVTLNSTTGAYIYNVEGTIKVGEGFMICTCGKNPFLEYDASEKSRNEKKDYINIIASNSETSDNLIIRFGENESSGFPKLHNFNDRIATVYVKESDVNYAIFNSNEDAKEIPVCFDAKEMGNYTLSFELKGDFENLVLLDRMTGEKINLLLENEYSFIAASDDNAERFVLLKDNGQQTTDNSHFAYINNGDIVITNVSGDADISIFDAMGRCIYNGNCTDAINRVPTGGFTAGVYVIQKNDDKGINVQKIILE